MLQKHQVNDYVWGFSLGELIEFNICEVKRYKDYSGAINIKYYADSDNDSHEDVTHLDLFKTRNEAIDNEIKILQSIKD